MPNLHRGYLAAIAVLLLVAPTAAQRVRSPGWTEATHGRDAAADYTRLFALDRVHEIRITIPPAQFAAMQEDLKTISIVPFGPNGPDFDPNGPGPGRGFGPGRGGPIRLTARDPMYVPVTVEHDGRAWTRVGMRFKGNSSLTTSVELGNGKLPFRLNFDRYEEESPEIQNQRFYGFQEMTFSSNFGDDSQLREVLANEVFRDRGIAAPRAAFYRVFVDTGSGPQYWGLYTMVEDPADGSMLQAQFGSRTGNLYKPDGPGADWTGFDAAGFEKKNNEEENDFGDVRAAIEALHAQAASPAAWRAALERTFDVNQFLRWLAVNSTISNWDTYGGLAHNYYLYADPAQGGRLRWIPWDNNFAFAAGPGAGGPGRGFGPPGGRGFGPPPGGRGGFGLPGRGGFGPPPGGFGGAPADVLHRQVGAEWPLIQRLLADPVYQARYRTELDRAVSGLMSPAAFERRARELHRLVTASVVGPQGERPTHTTISSAEGFQSALDGADGLIAFVAGRERAIRDALRTAPTP